MIIVGQRKGYEVAFYEWSSLENYACYYYEYPLGVPPNLRTNIDYTFILREPILIIESEFMKTMLECLAHLNHFARLWTIYGKLRMFSYFKQRQIK